MKRRMPPVDNSTGASLARLVPREVLRLDLEQRARHRNGNASEPIAEIATQSREEMAFQLHSATMAHQASDFDDLAIAARRIRRLSVQAGLPNLARAADHVLDCIVQCDSAALGATVARLHRLGLMALSELVR